MFRLSVCLLLGLLLASPLAHAGPVEDEAARQLQLAQEDLNAGELDRAIHAAKSARRLDPSLVDSLWVQALAAEQKRDLGQARALALAYRVGLDDPTLVDALLDRLDRAEPATATASPADDGTVVVVFRARDYLEDPVVHWKTPLGWKELWMEADERGGWTARVVVKALPKNGLQWWIEPSLGDPVVDPEADGPFRLAAR